MHGHSERADHASMKESSLHHIKNPYTEQGALCNVEYALNRRYRYGYIDEDIDVDIDVDVWLN